METRVDSLMHFLNRSVGRQRNIDDERLRVGIARKHVLGRMIVLNNKWSANFLVIGSASTLCDTPQWYFAVVP
jgi:hypothetical protein